MATSFIQRKIEIAVALAPDPQTNQPRQFADGLDTVTLSGHRTSVRISNSGAPAGGTAHVQIFGLQQSLMNQLATLGIVFNLVPINTITVLAGDSERGMSPVFGGTIQAAYGDYDAAPDVPFHFEANAGLAGAVAPAAASSFTGPTSVADIIAGLAQQMGFGFENNGIDTKLPTPYFSGNLWTQMQACAEHANINAEIVDGGTKVAIWPKGKSRTTPNPPLISAATGMIGYPSYTQQGIIVRTVFNPQIGFGGLVKVESDLKQANGTWTVQKLDLALDSLVFNGQWMATIYGYNPNRPVPLPPGT